MLHFLVCSRTWTNFYTLHFLLFFPFKIDSSFIQHIPTTVPQPTPPIYPHPLSPRSAPLPFCFQKREDFQKMTVKQDKACYTMTRRKPSYLDWRKKPNRRKRVSQAGKRVRDTSAPTKHQANCNNIHRGPGEELCTPRAHLFSLCVPYGPCLLDLFSLCSLGVLQPL